MIRSLILFCLCVPLHMVGQSPPRTNAKPVFVIVQGAWAGGWSYRELDARLSQKGGDVYRLSLTGMGDRVHLSSAAIGLDIHILDVINLILYEDLHEVILVGHSYGGIVITGVADSIPDRIRSLVYLDAALPEHGESLFMLMDSISLNEGIPNLIEDDFVIPRWVPADKLPPKDVPQSLKTMTDRITLDHPVANAIPAVFISCGWTDMELRARNRGWPVYPLGTDHNVQWSNPEGLANVLMPIVGE